MFWPCMCACVTETYQPMQASPPTAALYLWWCGRRCRCRRPRLHSKPEPLFRRCLAKWWWHVDEWNPGSNKKQKNKHKQHCLDTSLYIKEESGKALNYRMLKKGQVVGKESYKNTSERYRWDFWIELKRYVMWIFFQRWWRWLKPPKWSNTKQKVFCMKASLQHLSWQIPPHNHYLSEKFSH